MTCHVVKFQICEWKKIKILLYMKADSTIESEHLLRHLSTHSLYRISIKITNLLQNFLS